MVRLQAVLVVPSTSTPIIRVSDNVRNVSVLTMKPSTEWFGECGAGGFYPPPSLLRSTDSGLVPVTA